VEDVLVWRDRSLRGIIPTSAIYTTFGPDYLALKGPLDLDEALPIVQRRILKMPGARS